MNRSLASIFLFTFLVACNVSMDSDASSVQKRAPNILLMIADDMGVETLSCYGIGKLVAKTPNLDRLCAKGVKFTQFWVQPSCTPTRTALITGRHAFRTGSYTPTGPIYPRLDLEDKPKQLVDNQLMMAAYQDGSFIPDENAPFLVVRRTGKPPKGIKLGQGILPDELTLPNAIREFGETEYAMGAVGKWHLVGPTAGWLSHPKDAGFDHFVGNMKGGLENYYRYERVENGKEVGLSDKYATTEQVDDAITWINAQTGKKPWFLWLAFNAPHDGFHKPPNQLISKESQKLDPQGITPANVDAYFRAMIESLDHEIGRLLANIDEAELANTYVVFMGDNGTSQNLISEPFDREQGKGSVYRGSVNVPFIVNGPNISGGRSIDSPINVVDLFSTILKWTNTDIEDVKKLRSIDGVSFANILEKKNQSPVRKFNYADIKGWLPTGNFDLRTISDGQYKLIVDDQKNSEELYDLKSDPFEKRNLLATEGAGQLKTVRKRLLDALQNLSEDQKD
ncbi:MAG: sulfatase [Parasphingorhabdus sp.]